MISLFLLITPSAHTQQTPSSPSFVIFGRLPSSTLPSSLNQLPRHLPVHRAIISLFSPSPRRSFIIACHFSLRLPRLLLPVNHRSYACKSFSALPPSVFFPCYHIRFLLFVKDIQHGINAFPCYSQSLNTFGHVLRILICSSLFLYFLEEHSALAGQMHMTDRC